MKRVVCRARRTRTREVSPIGNPTRPSTVTVASCEGTGNSTPTVSLRSTTTDRALDVCALIGVITPASTLGCRIGPPADREYAVHPEGVATITPSAGYIPI